MGIFALAALWSSSISHSRALLLHETRMIGEELLTNTNSSRIANLDPESSLHKSLWLLLRTNAVIAQVTLTNEPSFVDDRKAASLLVLSNAAGQTLRIRLQRASERDKYDVLTFRRSEPGAPPNGGPGTRFASSGVTEGPPSVS